MCWLAGRELETSKGGRKKTKRGPCAQRTLLCHPSSSEQDAGNSWHTAPDLKKVSKRYAQSKEQTKSPRSLLCLSVAAFSTAPLHTLSSLSLLRPMRKRLPAWAKQSTRRWQPRDFGRYRLNLLMTWYIIWSFLFYSQRQTSAVTKKNPCTGPPNKRRSNDGRHATVHQHRIKKIFHFYYAEFFAHLKKAEYVQFNCNNISWQFSRLKRITGG